MQRDLQPKDLDFLATPLETIPLDVSLPFPIYVNVAGKKTCLRNMGDSLTMERVKSLETKVDTVFIPQDSWNQFLIQLENAHAIDKNDFQKAAKSIHSLLIAYSKLMEQMREVQRSNVNKLRKLAYDLVEIAYRNPSVTQNLLRKYKESSVYFASHSVNVCLYSIAIGKKLGLGEEDLKMLAFSCLVHNIGNALIPEEVLNKQGKLTNAEWMMIQNHAQQGAELLEYLNVPTEAVRVAKQHHERMDGKGYPQGIGGGEIHLFARICSIADVYDALTSNKPYGERLLSSAQAIVTMQEMTGKFDSEILRMIGNA